MTPATQTQQPKRMNAFFRNWFYYLARFMTLNFARLYYGIEVRGLSKVPREGGVLVVSNHISGFDPPVIGITMPRVVSFMAKKELFEVFWVRWLISSLKAFPVDRTGNASSAVKESIRRLKRGEALMIFAQGTRNAAAGQAFDGASFIAQRASVPILPAAIWREGRKYIVEYGEPFEAEGKGREAMKALTDTVMSKISELLPEQANVELEQELKLDA